MARSPWLTEREICDRLIKAEGLILRQILKVPEYVKVIPEANIGHGYRPDFLLSLYQEKKVKVFVVEAKITASVDAIIQVLTYKQLLTESWIKYDAQKRGDDLGNPPIFKLVIIARYFDKPVYRLAHHLDISLVRVNVDDDKCVSLEDEPKDFFQSDASRGESNGQN